MKKCQILLFEGFETLDVFGPLEILSFLEDVEVELCSLQGGMIAASQNYEVDTSEVSSKMDILLIPGGQGTRKLVDDVVFIGALEKLISDASFVLSVCTGSALLAKTSCLNHRQATTNKRAFSWVQSLNEKVDWQKNARWVVSDSIYTSSGVSAGMDMTLGFIADHYGLEKAEAIAKRIEYRWHNDSDDDPFAVK